MPYRDPEKKKAAARRAYYRNAGKPLPARYGGTGTEPAPTPARNILDSAVPRVQTVRPQVRETTTPVGHPAPLHDAAASVPFAGEEAPGTAPEKPTPEPIQLEPETMIALTKGAFAMVGLFAKARSHDDRELEVWKVEDDEIREIAEPMCRQAMRIPIVAALGQNTADLILIGATMGTLISLRISNSIELAKDRDSRRPPRLREREREGGGGTWRVAEAEGGDGRYQEVREPRSPEHKPNMAPFEATG